MENSGAALGALSFIVLIIGATLFFAAKAKRPLAKILLLGGLIALVAAIVITPEPVPAPIPSRSAPAIAEAAKPVAAAPIARRAAPALEPTTTVLTSEQRDSALSYIRTTAMQIVFCTSEVDRTQALIEKVNVGTASPMQAYTAAHAGERDCKKASNELTSMDRTPFSAPEWNGTYSRTLPACTSAIRDGKKAMTIAKAVLDGESGLALAQEYKDTKNGMAGKIYECKLGLFVLSEKAGIPKSDVDFLDLS